MRRNGVASTSFRRHGPTRFLINQCQIITSLILKSDNIENSRMELKGVVLPVPSNQIKVTFIIILPFNLYWYICDFFLFHIEIEGKCGWIMGGGGGGGKGYVAPPPSQIIGPPLAPHLPTPMSVSSCCVSRNASVSVARRGLTLLCGDHQLFLFQTFGVSDTEDVKYRNAGLSY